MTDVTDCLSLLLAGALIMSSVLISGCSGSPGNSVPTPVETPIQVPPGEAGPFFEEAFVSENQVVARYVPRSVEPMTYLVSYEVRIGGTTESRVEGRLYENISRTNPVVIVVHREPDETVAFDTAIRDVDGTVVWTSRASYGPTRITPLG
jgi:hypothetical protein